MNIKQLKKISGLKLIQEKVQSSLNTDELETNETPEVEVADSIVTATRRDYQLSRRLFHMGNGLVVAVAYAVMFTHQRAIYLLGTFACLLYLFDQIRRAYPNFSKRFERFSKYIMRAEEQLKESAMVPYVMAILLCILSMPKAIAIASILTLAFADPLSALIGIRYGKHHIVKAKSLEGSAAFWSATFLSIILVFMASDLISWRVWPMAMVVATIISIFEMIPIKLDDNLTIPLFTGYTLWIFCHLFGIMV